MDDGEQPVHGEVTWSSLGRESWGYRARPSEKEEQVWRVSQNALQGALQDGIIAWSWISALTSIGVRARVCAKCCLPSINTAPVERLQDIMC